MRLLWGFCVIDRDKSDALILVVDRACKAAVVGGARQLRRGSGGVGNA